MLSVLVAAGMTGVVALTLAQQAMLGAKIQKSAFVFQDIASHHDLLRLQVSNPDRCKKNYLGQKIDLSKTGSAQPLGQAAVAAADDFIKLGQAITSSGVAISKTEFLIDSVQAGAAGLPSTVYGNLNVIYTVPSQVQVLGARSVERKLALRLVTDSAGKIEQCGNSTVELNWGSCSSDKVLIGLKPTGDVICEKPPWTTAGNPLVNFNCPDGFVRSFDGNGSPLCGEPPALAGDNTQLRCGANGCKDEITSCTNAQGTPIQEGGFVTCFNPKENVDPTLDSKAACKKANGSYQKVANEPPLKKGFHWTCVL